MESVLLFFKDFLPGIVSLVAVIVSGYSISQARKAQLTATYFTEKAKAYGDYLDSVARFAYKPCDATRDNLSSTLYRLMLFASSDVSAKAQIVYAVAIERSRSGMRDTHILDEHTNTLGILMKKDLASFDKRKKF